MLFHKGLMFFGIFLLLHAVCSIKQQNFHQKMTLVQYFRFLRKLAIQERYIRASLAMGASNFKKAVGRTQFRRLKPSRQVVKPNLNISTTSMAPIVKQTTVASVKKNFWSTQPVCSGNITNCRVYLPCRSKMLCNDGDIYCCAPDTSFCPPSNVIGIKCRRSRNTNWCRTDSDCYAAPTQRCCPTGCNYNICI